MPIQAHRYTLSDIQRNRLCVCCVTVVCANGWVLLCRRNREGITTINTKRRMTANTFAYHRTGLWEERTHSFWRDRTERTEYEKYSWKTYLRNTSFLCCVEENKNLERERERERGREGERELFWKIRLYCVIRVQSLIKETTKERLKSIHKKKSIFFSQILLWSPVP